uniref:Putative capsid protein n=1 Tax=viral metagenome TaxID=1070528 RepID=A0A6H1ZVP0_9ZZZZ
MALPYDSELESITNDYFMADGGKAVDIYFNTSFLLTHLLKQHKGIWERPDGGMVIRIPLEYDGQEAGFYGKGDTLSSDDRESVHAAQFDWKHAFGNGTIYRIDGLKNTGDYAKVQLVTQRTAGAQKSITKILAGSIFDSPGGSPKRLTGLRALCNATTTLAYGGIQQGDLVSADGTYPWTGRMSATATTITLNALRTGASAAKIRDGAGGKPDLVVTTETNWNVIADILQAQQRFTSEGSGSVKAGFTGLYFEGKDIFPDDYSPASHMFFLNTNHIGFAVHKSGNFVRIPWRVIPDSPEDKTMKILWDGNMVCNNRKAHQGYSAMT